MTNGNSNTNLSSDEHMLEQKMKHLPKRIILVRHGESEGNMDETVLEYVPNYKIKLSKKGRNEAQVTGSKIRELIVSECRSKWKAFLYVSPLSRTRETMEVMMERFEKDKIVGVREECRLREQHFGNFQDVEERRKIKRRRNRYGKFFYRVPDGESSADVYDRVSSFIEGLWKDMECNKFRRSPSEEVNLIIVSHGLTILLFLMKWFHWTVDQFEALTNPGNCEYRVLELGPHGEYTLALHHHLHELQQWGLSDQMIEDQIARARAHEFHVDHKCVDACSDTSASTDDNVEEWSHEK